jgi:hypothetical protein
MTFVGIGIHYFDFTFLDIHETIYGLAGTREKRARRIVGNSTGLAQRFDVSGSQRSALHLM